MAFILPELKYDYDAFEPHFDAKTMEVHYTQHHAGYLKKFNEAIAGTDLDSKSTSEIFDCISQYPPEVRNNGGGYFNHMFFWNLLVPDTMEITDVPLSDAVVKYFGTIEDLKEEFSEAALKLFGSGWVWLIKKNDGQLLITSTPNQDNPLMDVVPIRGTPLLGLDLWEHAYYLRYQNNRKGYIEAFWNLVNWNKVAELYNNSNIK